MDIKKLLTDIRMGRSEDLYGWMIDLSIASK